MQIEAESWPIAGSFTISRGSKTAADVVVVTLRDGPYTGRGECVPYPRYDETVPGVIADLEAARGAIAGGFSRADVPGLLKLHAARNALDCALWDLESKPFECVGEMVESAVAMATIAADPQWASAAVVAGVHRGDQFQVVRTFDGPDDLGPHPSAGSENGYLHGSS